MIRRARPGYLGLVAGFKDFNFKLLVVEELMYNSAKLTPRFDIADVLEEQGLGRDPWEYAYENGWAYKVLPQAREYFEALEIRDWLLAGVQELNVDGGLEVYGECCPVWDGEDDLFDVRSMDDLDLLPNLRRVHWNGSMLPKDPLRARGVTVLG